MAGGMLGRTGNGEAAAAAAKGRQGRKDGEGRAAREGRRRKDGEGRTAREGQRGKDGAENDSERGKDGGGRTARERGCHGGSETVTVKLSWRGRTIYSFQKSDLKFIAQKWAY